MGHLVGESVRQKCDQIPEQMCPPLEGFSVCEASS